MAPVPQPMSLQQLDAWGLANFPKDLTVFRSRVRERSQYDRAWRTPSPTWAAKLHSKANIALVIGYYQPATEKGPYDRLCAYVRSDDRVVLTRVTPDGEYLTVDEPGLLADKTMTLYPFWKALHTQCWFRNLAVLIRTAALYFYMVRGVEGVDFRGEHARLHQFERACRAIRTVTMLKHFTETDDAKRIWAVQYGPSDSADPVEDDDYEIYRNSRSSTLAVSTAAEPIPAPSTAAEPTVLAQPAPAPPASEHASPPLPLPAQPTPAQQDTPSPPRPLPPMSTGSTPEEIEDDKEKGSRALTVLHQIHLGDYFGEWASDTAEQISQFDFYDEESTLEYGVSLMERMQAQCYLLLPMHHEEFAELYNDMYGHHSLTYERISEGVKAHPEALGRYVDDPGEDDEVPEEDDPGPHADEQA